MKITVGKGVLVVAAVALVKHYGKYKYYCGRCDANDINKIVIDAQQSFIEDLLNELKKLEAESN